MAIKEKIGGQADETTAPAPSPAKLDRKSRLSLRAEELLKDRQGILPVWVRAPAHGAEFHSGFSRAKLYQLAEQGRIRSASVRDPGKMRGTRLFNLQSILDFIATCETAGGVE
jgi:hypothetical protein